LYRIACCGGDPMGSGSFALTLERALEELNCTCLISHFPSHTGLLAVLTQTPHACDLIFLDALPGEAGVELARQLHGQAPYISVVLLMDGPARTDCADGRCLVKPVPHGQLRDLLLSIFPLSPALLLRNARRVQKVPLGQILYIEVFGHQLKIHTLSQQILSASGTLSQIQRDAAGGHFPRCHNSYLVNLAHVEGIRRYQVLLSGGVRVPASKKNYNLVRKSVYEFFSIAPVRFRDFPDEGGV